MTPEYLEANRWLARPFVWGESDCIMVLGDWIERQLGRDPFAGDRMTYDSAATCQRATGFFADPVGTLQDRFDRIGGLDRVDTPAAGDVAVVRLPGHRRPFGALHLGDCWAIKAPEGATTVRPHMVEPLAIWRVRDEA